MKKPGRDEFVPEEREGESARDVFESLLEVHEQVVDSGWGIGSRERWETETLRPWRERFARANVLDRID